MRVEYFSSLLSDPNAMKNAYIKQWHSAAVELTQRNSFLGKIQIP